jgi:hypothetical protein
VSTSENELWWAKDGYRVGSERVMAEAMTKTVDHLSVKLGSTASTGPNYYGVCRA